ADHAVVADLGPVAVELALEGVDAVLAVPEQDQVGRLEAADLPHELGADRAAGARDHDALAAEVAEDAVRVEPDRRPAEEVVDVDLADAAQVDLAGDDLVHAGDDLVREVGAGAPDLLDDVADLVAALRRDRDQHLVDVALGDHPRGVGDAPEHGHAGDALPDLRGVVVEERDGLHAGLGVAQQLAHDQGPGLAGADDEHALAEVGADD